MTLRQRALRAGIWTVVSHSVELSTRLLSNLIMTRLLFPEAFGLIAAAMALITGLQLLSDFGVRPVIIQSPRGEDPSFLRSAWTFQCSRGTLLWLILVAACILLHFPAVRSVLSTSSVFADPSFSLVSAVLGFSLVLGGLESTAIALNVRLLNFRPIVIVDLISRLAPLPFMIGWAYLFPSVWAIVAGTILSGVLRVVLSHVVIPGPRMEIAWTKEHIREIVTFGKWINLSSAATFVGSQSDLIILGLLLAGPLLGMYYIAKTLSDAIETLLERLNSSMSLPVLGEVLRENPKNLKDRYYRFRFPIELIAAGSAGFLFVSGGPIVGLLYDHRYAEAGTMLQMISFGLVIYPFQLIRSAFTAVAKTNIVAWVSVLQAISLIICLSIGYYCSGALGAIGGVAFSRLFPSIAMLVLAWREGWIRWWGESRWIAMYATGVVAGKAATYVLGLPLILHIRHFIR